LDSKPRMGYSAFISPDQVVRKMATNWCRYIKVKTLSIILLLVVYQQLTAESPLVLGPYDSLEELNEVTEFLNTNQIKFLLNNDAVSESLGFIVVTDPIGLSLADEVMTDLRDQGVKDLLYIRQGVYQGRISAGIYSSNPGANRRVTSLADSGLEFDVVERSRTISSSSIRVSPENISLSAVGDFEAITGVSLPLATKATRQIVENTSVPEIGDTSDVIPESSHQGRDLQAETATLQQPSAVSESTPTQDPVLKEDEKNVLKSKPATDNIIVRSSPPAKDDFPFVSFLLITAIILIIAGLTYFQLSRREKKSNTPHEEQATLDKITQPPTLTEELEAQQFPERQQERQLDGSVGAISAYANQILSGQKPGENEIPQYLATIQMGGVQVLDLISDIIDLSRIEIGQTEIERISFDPESALQDLIKSLLPKADDKGISLYFEAKEDLPDLIASDPGKIEKILLPLVIHAIEHTSSGRVSVTALFDESTELLEIAIKHSMDSFDPTQIEELFEATGSISNINNEKTLRFAVSKRFAHLLGGDIQLSHDSNQEIMYVVTIQADEILKKQLLLPSGVSIDELVASESRAVLEAEKAKVELESTQEEARLAATALSEAEQQARLLIDELEAAQSLASQEKDTRTTLESTTQESIERLNLDLVDTRNKLQTELNSLSQSEALAKQRVTELEAALTKATTEIENQDNARQIAEQAARGQVEQISAKLGEAETELIDAKAEKDAFTQAQQTNTTNRQEIVQLQNTLGKAKARLARELKARTGESQASSSQINTLQSQLETLKAAASKETENREQLEKKITTQTEDWMIARQDLETQLTQFTQLAEDNKLQAEHLATALKKARADAQGQSNAYIQLEQNAKEKLEGLELELGIARQQAIEEGAQNEEAVAVAKEELQTLRQQLNTAQASLKHSLAENNHQHGQEIDALQSALSLAEENLNSETRTKVRVEENSGSQIEALIDDVNQARTAARMESETWAELEKETQKQIDSMASELKDARKSLEAQAKTRLELERVNEFAKDTSLRLEEAESNTKQIQIEKDNAELQIAESSKALEDLRVEAERLRVAEEAARQKLQRQSDASGTSLTSKDTVPVLTSLSMTHPVLRSMVERFIERLAHQIQLMERSIQDQNYLNFLVSLNWLKGEAYNLGFSAFDTAISELELCLRQQDFEKIPNLVSQLNDIASRIVMQDIKVDDGSSLGVKTLKIVNHVNVALPENEKKADLKENFISQLGLKLLEMEAAWQEGSISRLEKNCKWIYRYSIKMRLENITRSTESLQTAIKRGDHDQISQRLWNFFTLYSNIRITRSPNT
jgi:signal transduction histidine kinase